MPTRQTKPMNSFYSGVFVALVLATGIGSCDFEQPAPYADLEHPDYRAVADEMIRERPTVLTVEQLGSTLDSATLTRISPVIKLLNDDLGRLAVLHQIHDTASAPELRGKINLIAMPFQLLADRSKNWIMVTLPETKRVWFHEFVEQKAAAAGLPHDVWSIEALSPIELRGVQHRPVSRHDTALTTRR
ncbi:MAG: hypothetical protein WEE89_06290 [Gemmatimonadota bacterium]